MDNAEKMDNTFSMPYQVAYYDTDFRGRMTVERLIAVAVLASETQSTALNRDAAYLTPLNLGWIITHYEINIDQLPKVLDKVEFFTRATTWNKFFCYRDFWVNDESGKRLVTVHTTFALMDLTTRKIKTVTEEIIGPFGGYKENKIKRPDKFAPIDETVAEALPYRVRYYDLDSNQHVNNSKYFTWLLDPLGKEFLESHKPIKITIRFDLEVSYGETIQSLYVFDEPTKISRHVIKNGDQIFTEAQVEWE